MEKKRLAIFASGSGSNALNLVNFFANHASVEVAFVLSNKKRKQRCLLVVLEIGFETKLVDNDFAADGMSMTTLCQNEKIDIITLAGYLRKIPNQLVEAYPNRIINIHPSLLPNYGGAGMYGMNVHNAVIAAGEKQSGMTIHFVNEQYDEGQYVAQFFCALSSSDKPEDVAKKVQSLEHAYFPKVVEQVVLNS